jgi:hypothetical protein
MRILLSALVLLITVQTAIADDKAAEKARILAFMQHTFNVIASGDPEQWQAILTEKAHNLSFSGVNLPQGEWRMRERAYKDRLAQLDGMPTDYLERWIGEPTVLIRGPIAVVWGEYEFWIDGEFSHCGVDTVNLAKIDGTWKIAHFMYTAEPEGCPDGYPRRLD